MRKWGIVVSLLYALIVLGLLVPGMAVLGGYSSPLSQIFLNDMRDLCIEWIVWVPVAAVLCGQVARLFLSADTSQKRLKPRAHIMVSYTVTAMLFALLTFAALSSLGAAVYSDKFLDRFWPTETYVIVAWGILWLLWGIVFFLFFRNSNVATSRLVSWLLKGSVLELLIAVPCHVIVRRRDDCSAPVATSFGIATGVAVMLLSFGPGVLLLYKKRLDAYAAHEAK
jgi:tryptophan-rich sensory protein